MPLGAASFGSLVRITQDYRPEQVGQIGILESCLPNESGCDIRFSVGSDFYNRTEFELIRTSSNPSKDLQPHLIGHLNALLAVPNVDAANIPLLLFVASKLQEFILFDEDGVKRVDIEISLFNACQFLRFGYEDLTNGSKFGRRVSGVFVDAAFEKLKKAAVILNADAVAVVS